MRFVVRLNLPLLVYEQTMRNYMYVRAAWSLQMHNGIINKIDYYKVWSEMRKIIRAKTLSFSVGILRHFKKMLIVYPESICHMLRQITVQNAKFVFVESNFVSDLE
jgi:hypothetical protein